MMNSRRSNWLSGVLALSLLLTTAFAAEEEARLEQFFKNYLEEQFRLRPLDATRLGDHRFDHLLDDLSPEARKKQTDLSKRTLKELPKAVDYKRLSRNGQIDFEILKHELETGLWLDENTRPYETNPRLYNEYISDSVFQLLVQSRLPLETNVANAVSRISQVPKVI